MNTCALLVSFRLVHATHVPPLIAKLLLEGALPPLGKSGQGNRSISEAQPLSLRKFSRWAFGYGSSYRPRPARLIRQLQAYCLQYFRNCRPGMAAPLKPCGKPPPLDLLWQPSHGCQPPSDSFQQALIWSCTDKSLS